MEQTLWVEKYRPKNINECVITDKVAKTLNGFISKKTLPNLMLTSGPGMGKTTLARAIVRQLDADYLFIDCSTSRGKSMIEEMIIPFAETISINNPDVPKIIICDESDGLLVESMRSLRPVIEKYAITTRFIFTGNYPERFIPAIKSRCSQIDLSVTNEDKPYLMMKFYQRCEHILKEHNISYDQQVLGMFINKYFPDFRKIINELQSYSSIEAKIDSGILTLSSDSIASAIYPMLIEKRFDDCRKWLAESVVSPSDVFTSLYNNMKDYIKPQEQPEVILIIAQYQFYSSHVVNQQLNLMACFTEIMMKVSG